jgi:hypothetical protein
VQSDACIGSAESSRDKTKGQSYMGCAHRNLSKIGKINKKNRSMGDADTQSAKNSFAKSRASECKVMPHINFAECSREKNIVQAFCQF